MITLINPPGVKSTSPLQIHFPNPPLGLAYISAFVKESGRQCHIIDATGEALDLIRSHPLRDDLLIQGLTPEEVVDRIPEDTNILGISCMFSSSWPITRDVLVKARKKFPNVFMVAGGEHVTALPDYVLNDAPLDAVVLGEGEETFLSLIGALEQGMPLSNVKGIAFVEDGAVIDQGLSPRNRDIDAIPVPDWEAIPMEEYISRNQTNGINLGRSMPLLTTRGCPYRCTFCSNDGMWTTRYVPRDPKLVVDEMEAYVKRYNVTNFNSQDLTAIVKRSWAIDFCKELIARDLNITWQMPTGTRSEVFDDEIVDLLYRSGCRLLSFAPESGSPVVLDHMKKKINLANLDSSIRNALKRDFTVSCFIVIGYPTETPADSRMTIKLIRKFAFIGVHDITVSKFVPYPGSEMFRQLLKEGAFELNDAFLLSPMDMYAKGAPSYAKAISSRKLYWTMIWMFVNFYVLSFVLRPMRMTKVMWKAIFSGIEETKYAKWFVYRFHTQRKWRHNRVNARA